MLFVNGTGVGFPTVGVAVGPCVVLLRAGAGCKAVGTLYITPLFASKAENNKQKKTLFKQIMKVLTNSKTITNS